jgi:lysophospholipase L1-like esterase
VPVCGNFTIEYSEECDDGPNGSATCDIFCNTIAATALVPLNQFNIGDSIGEGEAANGTIGAANHQAVWSTGYDGGDIVNSLNERFEARDAAAYVENNATRDPSINQAVSGAVMADFADQAQDVADAMGAVEPHTADMVSILLGNNDVCASSLDTMTDPDLFEQQYRAGLTVLASSPFTATINLQISSIPAIYWLWDAKRTDFWCRVFAWPFVPCENLLSGAADDCVSSASAQDPDVVYTGDGPNCQRRKEFHARIRDVYNPILRDVLAEYQVGGDLPNAEYVDIYDVRFESRHVNGGDCFHPSKEGHALMSGEQWCRSSWGETDPSCSP